MAHIIRGQNGLSVYPDVVGRVRLAGTRRESRNGPTYNLNDVVIALDSPLSALPLNCGRKLSTKIAAFETLQLIGAFSDPKRLVEISERFRDYLEPDGEAWGAYGNRIGAQLQDVHDKLRYDPWTRQAIISMWDTTWDNEPGKRDYPCTVAIGVSLDPSFTHDKLNMRVAMRSNDAWLGLPYDMFQFTQLQLTLCNIMGYEPGTYVHNAWSLHLYMSDTKKSYDVQHAPPHFDAGQPVGIGREGDSVEDVWHRARCLASGDPTSIPDATESESWYLDALR